MSDGVKLDRISRREFGRLSFLAATGTAVQFASGCASSRSHIRSTGSSSGLILENCQALNVHDGSILQGACLHIVDGRIATIGPQESIRSSGNTQRLDLGGAYVIPGLIDAHAHTTFAPAFSFRTGDIVQYIRQRRRQFQLSITSGVTTIRDMGSFPPVLHGFVDDIAKGKIVGPRIVYCNSILNIRGGHPDIPPGKVHFLATAASLVTGNFMTNFDSLDELRKCLQKNTRGASFIKLTVDDRSAFCGRSQIPVYTTDHLREIFTTAERLELPVSCHCLHASGFQRMLDYPINSLEHIVADRDLSDAEIEKMAGRNTALVPTMALGQSYLLEDAFDTSSPSSNSEFIRNELAIRRVYLENEAYEHCLPELHDKNMEMISRYGELKCEEMWGEDVYLVKPDLFWGILTHGMKNLLRMKDAGVLIGCGFDAGMPFCYFGGIYREMELLERIGFSPAEVLRCATVNNAHILGLEDQIGSLDPGKFADLVVVERNPLQDLKTLRKPLLVLSEGIIKHRTAPTTRGM